MSKHDEYIERLDKIEKDISWIIQYLLNKDEHTQPNLYNDPLHGLTKCSKCGLVLSHAMGYVCYQFNCPSGLGETSSISG